MRFTEMKAYRQLRALYRDLILAVRCPESGAGRGGEGRGGEGKEGHDDELSGYLGGWGVEKRGRGRGGQGVRPAGIYVGRQLGGGEAISGEDLSV